jgi:hypothetical protein
MNVYNNYTSMDDRKKCHMSEKLGKAHPYGTGSPYEVILMSAKRLLNLKGMQPVATMLAAIGLGSILITGMDRMSAPCG